MAIKVAVHLEEDAAAALAQLAKRFTWEDANRLSNRFASGADGRPERDHMLDGVFALQRALAEAGHDPR